MIARDKATVLPEMKLLLGSIYITANVKRNTK